MPITQQRLISLIDVSTNLNERLKSLRDSHYLSHTLSALIRGDTELAAELLNDFATFLNEKTTLDPATLELLLTEHAHFKFTRKRNDKARAAMRRNRGSSTDRETERTFSAIDIDLEATQLPPSPDQDPTECPRCGLSRDHELDTCPKCQLTFTVPS